MKRTIKLAVAAAVALTSTAAFATNGDTLIGTGAKARGMGGIGIGMSHGAESALSNPSLISSVKGTEISFGGTVFMPDITTSINGGMTYTESAAKLSVIPEVAIAQKVSDNFYWGIGMFGVAGMGTDYRDVLDGGSGNANMQMVTNLQLMQFVVPLTYKADGLSVGIAPVLQYGSLDMNYDMDAQGPGAPSSTKGVAQDLGMGYNLGLSYEADGLTVGASYKSKIEMNYKGQISIAAQDFGLGVFGLTDRLDQPAEIGVGTSYEMGQHTFAVDFKKIQWSKTQGYGNFGWNDQNVYMLGYEFSQDNWVARAGYNYAKSAVRNTAELGGAANMLNLVGFPATAERHYTVGGTYAFSKMTSLDLAYVYAPETVASFTTTITKHSEQSASAQVNFNF